MKNTKTNKSIQIYLLAITFVFSLIFIFFINLLFQIGIAADAYNTSPTSLLGSSLMATGLWMIPILIIALLIWTIMKYINLNKNQ